MIESKLKQNIEQEQKIEQEEKAQKEPAEDRKKNILFDQLRCDFEKQEKIKV